VDCPVCETLKRTYEAWRSNYNAARTGVYHLICTKLVASIYVEMERAKNDLEDHGRRCVNHIVLPLADAHANKSGALPIEPALLRPGRDLFKPTDGPLELR
jgi:hypothetical protein